MDKPGSRAAGAKPCCLATSEKTVIPFKINTGWSIIASLSQGASKLTERKGYGVPKRPRSRPKTGTLPLCLQLSDISPEPLYRQMAQWALADLPRQIPFARYHPTQSRCRPRKHCGWMSRYQPVAVFVLPNGSREEVLVHAPRYDEMSVARWLKPASVEHASNIDFKPYEAVNP